MASIYGTHQNRACTTHHKKKITPTSESSPVGVISLPSSL